MPDIYISRSGMESKQLDEKFTQTELGMVKAEVDQLEQAAKIKDDRISQMEKAMEKKHADLEAVAKIIQKNPAIGQVEAALKRKEQQPSNSLSSEVD